MILPMARQGGASVRTGLHLQEQFGDRSLRSSPLEQNVKEPGDNFFQSRRHPVLAWQPGAEEGSPSSTESIAVGDLVFPSSDVSTFQKLRGGATYVSDVATFSEDEDALDSTQDGSPMPLGRWRKQAGYSATHLNLSTNIYEVTPDELSTHSEDCSFHRVKLLCSYGGKIFPRPTDNQLRYVGGDTRLITVSRDIHFHELMQKMAELYAHAHTIKYKLPEEDLDALVSVSSNEDVANMMEEYDRLQLSDASPRFRLFLFSDVDHESLPSNELLVDQRSTEQRYVDAVNAIPETCFRKLSGDGASLAVAPVVIDSLIDVVDSWGFIRQQDVVPMAMLAPQISQSMASLNHHVPVALPVSSISAPSSAPSSPPLIPRAQKQGLTPEMRLMLHSDQHPSVSFHNIVQADGGAVGAVDGDIDGVSSVNSRIVSERTNTSSDLQRGLESPRKLQHAADALCTRQELVVHDDICRTPEVRMPQISSHVKLTRLSDHHLEAAAGSMHRHSYQQPQQSQQHGCWQSHLLEEQSQSYSRRAELGQAADDVAGQPMQQLQQLQLRSPFQNALTAPTIDPAIYPSTDHQSQVEEVCAPLMPQSISTNAMGPFYLTAESSHYVGVGSAPSSPRMNYTGQPYSQLQQALRSCGAPIFAEQPHCFRQHSNIDGSNRAGLRTSPPRYRDHLGQTEDRLSRPVQQPVLASSDTLQLELFLYDGQNSAHSQCSDGVARSQVPHYLGLNPFHGNPSSLSDSSSSETQDGGDGRRQRKRTSQQALHTPHVIAREDMHDQNSLSNESLLAHSGCQESSMDRVILHRGRDVDETTFRRLEKRCTGQREQVNEHLDEEVEADLEAIEGSFPHVLGGSEHLLALSGSHLPKDTDVVASVSGSYQQSRSITSEVLMMPRVLSTLRQASVLDITQVPLVGRECEPGSFAETAPRSVEGMPEFDSSPALFKVCQLSPEVYLNEMVSRTEDNKAAIDSCNNPSVSNTRAVNSDAVKTAELRWTERHDDNESGLVLQTRDRSDTLDHYQQVSGSVIPQGRHSESSTRIEASEVALQLLQSTSSITQGDAAFAEDVENTSASGPRNLLLHDVNPPLKTQFPLSIGQTQVMQPVTTRVTSFTIPALSITVSAELSMPSMLSVSASTSNSVGTSITEHEANCMDSRLHKPEPITPRNFQADVRGVIGQDVDFRRKDAKVLISQISATGHLAEDVASSVLACPRREMLAPLSSTINMQAENKGNWHFLSQEAPAFNPPNLFHAPTFSASNWNNVQNLTVIDDAQSCTPDVTAVIEDSRLQCPTIMKEDLTATEVRLEEFAEWQTILNADLEEMRELGSGTFGTVYHGKWRGTDVAIKRIKSSCFAGRPAERDRLIADFWREACTLSQLHHPNVVAFYGVVRDGPGGTLATVTEYMVNGSLKQVLQKKDRTIDRRKRLLIAMDAAFGMEYLHSKNIVHFDLKCDNLLVNMRDSHRPICKVGDLGLSKVKHQTMVSGGVRGTLPWMAPELLNGSSTLVTEKVDVFSFGIVMWELLTGEEPYASMHYGAIIGGIVNNTLRPTIPTWCDPLWKSLMERCWSAEPTFRPSFSEVASELRVMAPAPQPKAHG